MNAYSLTEDRVTKDTISAPISRKQRDKLLRRADILRAAERVFALKGYSKAKMQDIAREAQYATGTVYLYFKDKNALYFSLVEDKLRYWISITREKTERVDNAKKKLEIFLYENFAFLEKNQDFFRIFFMEKSRSEIEKRISKGSLAFRPNEYVTELIKAAQHQKLVRTDIAAARIADLFTSMFLAVAVGWLRGDEKQGKDLKSSSGYILDMFLNGAGVR